MRNVNETLEWYKKHNTTSSIGYNPNGMCLKICREARGIGSKYPSAKIAQDNTPEKYRVKKISEIRQGDVLYYDRVGDSNPYGHIVTVAGRVSGANQNNLSDILVWTNSAVSGRLVIVRGDYFPKHWGDPFVFGARWLNGYELIYPKHYSIPKKPSYNIKPKTVHGPSLRMQMFRALGVYKKKPTPINSVARVQKALNNVYGADLKIDGIVGKKFLDVWRKHERAVGVSGRPGVADRETLDALAKGRFNTSWKKWEDMK